ncbi:hypothetical protein EVAR_95113_1 [Eumeta japonica]|uniref:Uncharacterized protein n=1 Tax=Eumeta variegata TaxID=151549 RepID=A0A4C2A634_EUMVA|nr:hypothetical protein EVAR_95113_1 [Eumeta japonica]
MVDWWAIAWTNIAGQRMAQHWGKRDRLACGAYDGGGMAAVSVFVHTSKVVGQRWRYPSTRRPLLSLRSNAVESRRAEYLASTSLDDEDSSMSQNGNLENENPNATVNSEINIPVVRRRSRNPPELQEASNEIKGFSSLNSVLSTAAAKASTSILFNAKITTEHRHCVDPFHPSHGHFAGQALAHHVEEPYNFMPMSRKNL